LISRGQRGPEALFVGAALGGVDGVGEGVIDSLKPVFHCIATSDRAGPC
jgi:hypothetical protein